MDFSMILTAIDCHIYVSICMQFLVQLFGYCTAISKIDSDTDLLVVGRWTNE